MTADDFEALRVGLPVDDPDRHDLDGDADRRFAALVKGAPVSTAADYPGWVPPHAGPDSCSPVDFAASVAAGYVQQPDWGSAPMPTTATVETGGAL
ncbi:hypothetical protein ACWERV_17280 [Streptomyces sp. NPDC004031]